MNQIINLILTVVGVLLVGAIIVSSISPAIAGNYRSNFERVDAAHNRPPTAGKWKRTPTVIVCEHAPVERSQILKAVKFWENLGHSFFTTQYKNDPLNKCKQVDPIGYIIIHLATQELKLDGEELAETHFYVDNDHQEIQWGVIYIKKDLRETVLEHEIGHALGFLHYNHINHLMNSKWVQGGWDTNGLERRRQ
jgi:predicted Zn-dependent protease